MSSTTSTNDMSSKKSAFNVDFLIEPSIEPFVDSSIENLAESKSIEGEVPQKLSSEQFFLPWYTTIRQTCGIEPKRIGHPYQNRTPATHKKPRTSFAKKQVAILEARFKDQKYLASAERALLANQLEMSDAQVKTWWQNRRCKWRRQEAEAANLRLKNVAHLLSSFTTQLME